MSVPSRTTNACRAFAAQSAVRSFGARAASRPTVSVTYLQAVAIPNPEPGRQIGERLAFAQVGQHQQRPPPGASLCRHDPIRAR